MNRHRHLAVVAAAVLLALAAQRAAAADDSDARFAAGLMHLRDGRADLAVEEFSKATKANGKNSFAYKGLGLAYLQQRKFKEAIEAFRKALAINPYFVDVRNDLGSALIASGKRDEGRKELLGAFTDPTNPTPEFSSQNLGQAYLDEKNYAEAMHWFRTSIARNKAFPLPYRGMADALEATGHVDEALAELEMGLKEAPDDASLLTDFGERLLRAGRFNEARTQLEAALKKDPGGPNGRRAAQVLKTFPK